jgi:membrane peptidoglycan carboxypeptidase
VRFGSENVQRDYDVAWDGALSCRVVEAPPAIDTQRFKTKFARTVFTPEGEPRELVFGPESETWVPLGSISHFVVGAVLTTEHGRFFRHNGFDQEAIVNSIRENLKERRFVRGASTISMQLAKNLYLPRTKTLSRKLQEAVLTLYLEQQLTKDELMELYLNVIEFGPMVYGIGPAARHYFNTTPAELSLSQAMYLASILRNPKKQYFGAGGAVSSGYTAYLRRLMKITEKIGRISEEELELGLRETAVFGSPYPHVAPPEDEIPPETPEGAPPPADSDPEGEPTWIAPTL